jgi:hypothetical protein
MMQINIKLEPTPARTNTDGLENHMVNAPTIEKINNDRGWDLRD